MSLIITLLKRPYVFAFLAAYLFLAWRIWGGRRTLLWLISGYIIAWASEFSSIHTGFPYGQYFYLYENMPGELMVFGVPFFDSLSYPFMIFAGWSSGVFMLRGRNILSTPLRRALLGALLTMLLDIIIDPLAHLGERWFLGRIYYYESPGWYFDVPLSNFAGWFAVAFLVCAFNEWCWTKMRNGITITEAALMRIDWMYPAFFFGIALFNVTITAWLGEWWLLAASTLWCACAGFALFGSIARG